MYIVLAFIWLCVLFACLPRRNVRLPGPRPKFLIGNALVFVGSPQSEAEVFQRLYGISIKYKRMAALWLGPKLVLAVFNHKDAGVVLRSRCTKKADEYRFFKEWLGDSILISEGTKFKKHKKMIAPSFQPSNLKQFMAAFNKYAEQETLQLEDKLDGDEFDVYPHIVSITMRALLETSIGVTEETMGMKLNEYTHIIEILTRTMLMRTSKVWLRPDFIFNWSKLKQMQSKYVNKLYSFGDRVISERKAVIDRGEQNDENQRPMFLDNFLRTTDEHGNGFTIQEIRDELNTLLFGGQDTITVSLSFCLCLLGLYQDIQNKVYEEITSVFDSDRLISYDDCKSLQYLEQVIQETWRLYPPAPLIGKTATDDIPLDENYTIPKGCSIALILMLIHRDETVYPNPHQFNPDNFAPERVRERSPYAFIPFSAGSRTCIGPRYAMQLMKVTLAIILRKFRVISTIPESKYKTSAEVTLKRSDGFPISLVRRNKI